MEKICKIIEKEGDKWIVFNPDFNDELTPEILEFLSKHQRVEFGEKFDQPVDNLPESITY